MLYSQALERKVEQWLRSNDVNWDIVYVGRFSHLHTNKWEHYKYVVKLNGQVFDYHTGVGRTGSPRLSDVLSCLLLDAEALEYNFEDWCDNYGYDHHKRKAYDTYNLCRENGDRLERALGMEDWSDLKELLEDY